MPSSAVVPLPAYVHDSDAIADVAPMRDALLASKYMAKSPLAGGFSASKGFAFVFSEHGRSEALGAEPALLPFWHYAQKQAHRLTPLWRKAPTINAYYLNLLVLGEGQDVGAHVDATLRTHCASDTIIPAIVTVLYLLAPAAGGALVLDGHARIVPHAGAAVSFRGDINHSVENVEAGMRVSLVLEQYSMPADTLATMAHFRVQSKAGFSAYLRPSGVQP